jgi:hypothetical protein
MKTWIVLALVLAGCDRESPGVKAANRMADEVCACKDLACASKAAAAGRADLEKLRDSLGSSKDADRVVAAGKRAAECVARLGKL